MKFHSIHAYSPRGSVRHTAITGNLPVDKDSVGDVNGTPREGDATILIMTRANGFVHDMPSCMDDARELLAYAGAHGAQP
jgi:hypothetical protein